MPTALPSTRRDSKPASLQETQGGSPGTAILASEITERSPASHRLILPLDPCLEEVNTQR